MNVLVIEDEAIIALYIETILSNLGYRVLSTASSAQKAFECADKNKIDLIVSDIKVEGELDGIDICRKIQLEHGCAVIFITAFKDEKTVKKALGVEIEGYLIKPFKDKELQRLAKRVERSILLDRV